jgi:hypothetical protein
MVDKDKITIQDLYPDLTPEEQAEAERNLLAYLDVVRRIFERLKEEGRLDEDHLREEWKKGSRKQ